jgi:two-component system, chemotaxis family, chemotaxis protein CheY
MPQRVLDVGNCSADHVAIRGLLTRQFQAEVVRAHSASDALTAFRSGPFALVLVNRILDGDGSPGLDLVRTLKADPQWAATPVMLVSNFPEAQQEAVNAGAALGFGKVDLYDAETRARLSQFIG